MGTGTLTIDLDALVANYHALEALGPGATGAVVKADGYGLGVECVAKALVKVGAERFFVATSEEGAILRKAVGPAPEIKVFAGHMAGDTALIRDAHLTPMLNSPQQVQRHHAALPGAPFGVQLDSGMHRLGVQSADWAALRDQVADATLVMSHLACADEPGHPQNAAQLAQFRAMTDGLSIPRSLAATGGTLLGPDYHFDLIRPGIGLYGGLPFAAARHVVRLSLPVVQIRTVAPGGSVGYAAAYTATEPRQIGTISAGYADGLIRAMSSTATLWDGDTPCPLIGRVSMDLLTVDVTDCAAPPAALDILGAHQTVDQLADAAGTIGYEILTSLGSRYRRVIVP